MEKGNSALIKMENEIYYIEKFFDKCHIIDQYHIRLDGLNEDIVEEFLDNNVYLDISDLETKYKKAYNYLKQIEGKKSIRPALPKPKKIKGNLTEKILKKAERRIAHVLYAQWHAKKRSEELSFRHWELLHRS